MQYINELHILFVTYHLYLFTGYMSDTGMRDKIGLSLQLVMTSCITISIGVITCGCLVSLILWLK